jgi:hypothetical protein
MKLRHWSTAIALLLLAAAAITGMVWTGAWRPPPESEDSTATPAGKKLLARTQAANERPLQTAQRMAALAGTPEELRLAQEAEKVGDHEAGLALADALRSEALNPAKLTAEAKADAAVKADQETIAGTNYSSPFRWIRILVPSSNNHSSWWPRMPRITRAKPRESGAGATTRYRVRSFSAEPAINVRPTASGVELRVRSITRGLRAPRDWPAAVAAVVELMHKRREEVAR